MTISNRSIPYHMTIVSFLFKTRHLNHVFSQVLLSVFSELGVLLSECSVDLLAASLCRSAPLIERS